MIELILPEQPVFFGNPFQTKIRWEEPLDVEQLKITFSWIFRDGGSSHKQELAETEFKWPGRSGEETSHWRLPVSGPYSFDAAEIHTPVGLQYWIEGKAKPGPSIQRKILPTLPPGLNQPIKLQVAELPSELELPRLLKFILKNS